jgi:hypothetical protein
MKINTLSAVPDGAGITIPSPFPNGFAFTLLDIANVATPGRRRPVFGPPRDAPKPTVFAADRVIEGNVTNGPASAAKQHAAEAMRMGACVDRAREAKFRGIETWQALLTREDMLAAVSAKSCQICSLAPTVSIESQKMPRATTADGQAF